MGLGICGRLPAAIRHNSAEARLHDCIDHGKVRIQTGVAVLLACRIGKMKVEKLLSVDTLGKKIGTCAGCHTVERRGLTSSHCRSRWFSPPDAAGAAPPQVSLELSLTALPCNASKRHTETRRDTFRLR